MWSSCATLKIVYFLMLVASILVVWDRWWLLSKYTWIYCSAVAPVVKEVLFGSVLPRPSLVILERREGSVNMYLIKAAWEFHGRGEGGYY